MNKKGDENRSVRNTKRKLNQSLIQLMGEKQITQISVKELTELADVNRGTFYFHYTDIYDMLRQTEEEFFVEFEAIFNEVPCKEYSSKLTRNYMEAIFTFVYENRDFCRGNRRRRRPRRRRMSLAICCLFRLPSTSILRKKSG